MEETPIPLSDSLSELDIKEKLIKINEYIIKKNNISIDIILGKTTDNIIIRSFYYQFKFNQNDLSLITKVNYNSLDEAYQFIKNSFEQEKVFVKDITKSMIKLIINIYDIKKNKEKEIEICLKAKLINDGYIIYNLVNKYFELEQKINNIQKDNQKLIEENKNIKEENKKIIEKCNAINNENLKLKEENAKMKNEILNKEILKSKENNNFKNVDIKPSNMMRIDNNNQNFFQQTNILNPQKNISNNLNQKTNIKNEIINHNENENEKFSVIFKTRGNNYICTILCCKNDKISDLIQKFRKKSGDFESIYFFYNNKHLNESLTVNESGLIPNSFIICV